MTVVQNEKRLDHIINYETKPTRNEGDLYLDLDLIFLLFLFSLLIRFFLHLALMAELSWL